MFDMTKLVKRYFDVKLPNGLFLEVEPPKMKSLNKIMKLANIKEDDTLTDEALNDMVTGLALALSKNKQRRTVTSEQLTEMMDFDDMMELLTAYFNWVGEIHDSKN